MLEGTQHPDRNAQFEYINTLSKRFMRAEDPVISVDTKKKELVGPYARGGREWQPKGEPERVWVHDFIDPKLGKAIPYGVYDVEQDQGWVNVGIDHDTASFAAQSIRRCGVRWVPGCIRARDDCSFAPTAVEISERYDMEFERIGCDRDQIHLLCSAHPKVAPWQIVRVFKGITAREIFRRKPVVKRVLWGGGF